MELKGRLVKEGLFFEIEAEDKMDLGNYLKELEQLSEKYGVFSLVCNYRVEVDYDNQRHISVVGFDVIKKKN